LGPRDARPIVVVREKNRRRERKQAALQLHIVEPVTEDYLRAEFARPLEGRSVAQLFCAPALYGCGKRDRKAAAITFASGAERNLVSAREQCRDKRLQISF